MCFDHPVQPRTRRGKGKHLQRMARGLHLYLICLHASCLALLVFQIAQAIHGTTSVLDGRTLLAVVAYTALCAACDAANLLTTAVVSQNLGTAAYMGSIFLFAPPFPMVITLVAALLSQLTLRNIPLLKRAFNVSHAALTVGLTSAICSAFFRPVDLVRHELLSSLPAILFVVAVFYILDVGNMLGLLVLLGQGSPWQIWWRTFRYSLFQKWDRRRSAFWLRSFVPSISRRWFCWPFPSSPCRKQYRQTRGQRSEPKR